MSASKFVAIPVIGLSLAACAGDPESGRGPKEGRRRYCSARGTTGNALLWTPRSPAAARGNRLAGAGGGLLGGLIGNRIGARRWTR